MYNKNLKNLYEDAYIKLSKTTELIDVLDDIIDGERKAYVILNYIRENVKDVINNLEESKNIIENID